MQIAGITIGERNPPFIIAEISANHNGNYSKAREMIIAAKDAGASAVKLQLYKPEDLTSEKYPELLELYRKAMTPREWFPGLFAQAKAVDIPIFASAFSVEGIEYLESLKVPCHKIASMEIRDRDLVEAALATGKPVLISTGMATEYDVHKWDTLSENVLFLHCVSKYPTRLEEANLNVIANAIERGGDMGYSDHTARIEAVVAATALGACVIECHFKLDDDCIDAAYSLDPDQFTYMCRAVRAVHKGMGDGVIRPTCEPRKR